MKRRLKLPKNALIELGGQIELTCYPAINREHRVIIENIKAIKCFYSGVNFRHEEIGERPLFQMPEGGYIINLLDVVALEPGDEIFFLYGGEVRRHVVQDELNPRVKLEELFWNRRFFQLLFDEKYLERRLEHDLSYIQFFFSPTGEGYSGFCANDIPAKLFRKNNTPWRQANHIYSV